MLYIISRSQCAESETSAMGQSLLAATVVVMTLLTLQLPAGAYVCAEMMCKHFNIDASHPLF